MPNGRYISYPIQTSPEDLMQTAFDFLQSQIPGWTPSEGNLDVWLIEATASEGADVATLATQVPKNIFRYYGATLFNILPIDDTPASATSTWYLRDTVGHSIDYGTQVGIRDGDGNLMPFQVLSTVIVPGGQDHTQTAQVVLTAVFPGSASSDLGVIGGEIEMIDTLSWVDHIVQESVSVGGVDGETDDEYLNRLSIELQTMSPRPILPTDFAILARKVPGVQRAVAIDGYNPLDDTYDNERMVAVVATDAAGNDVGSDVKNATEAYLESMREQNFVVNMMSPQYHNVDVTVHALAADGFVPSDVQGRVTSAIGTFLDPSQWGIERTDNPNNPATWNNQTVVRYNDLVALVKNVRGVDILQLLTVGPMALEQDYDLTGIVPLPRPGVISVTVT